MEPSNGSKQPAICSHSEKDMGVLVDDKLKYYFHTQSRVANANQTPGLMKRTFCSSPQAVITKLLNSLIRSKLEFGMCITTLVNKGEISIPELVQQCVS